MPATIKEIVRYFIKADDVDARPQRFNDGLSGTPVAVSRTTAEVNNTWHNPLGTDDGGSMSVAVFREPLRAFAVYSRNPLGTGSNSYQWLDTYGNTNFSVAAYSQQAIRPRGANVFAPTNDLTLHGQTLFCGRDTQGARYLWQDADGSPSSFIYVTVNSIALGNGALLLFRCDGRVAAQPTPYQFTAFTQVTGTSSMLAIPITQNGYYRIEIHNGSANNLSFTFMQSCWCNAFWAQLPMTSYVGALQDFLSISMDSVGLEWRNSGAPLYVNGEVVGCEFDITADWQTYAAQGSASLYTLFTTVATQLGYMTQKMKNGLFTCLRPNDLDNFELKRPITFLDPAAATYTGDYSIVAEAPWKLFVGKVSPSSSSAQTQMHIINGFRYGSNDQLKNPQPPQDDPQSWIGAVAVSQMFPVFWSIADFSLEKLGALSAPDGSGDFELY